jgi:glycosyltransferase involved in cell wall biosynthesis
MVLLIRSTDVNPDPRVQKYIDYYTRSSIDYKIIAWNRDGNELSKENTIYINKKSSYENGFNNISKLIFWNIFILKQLLLNRKKIKLIHACDFDTVLPCVFMSILFHKKFVYDIFDWYTDSRSIPKPINYVILAMEKVAIKLSYRIILCETERLLQIPFKINPNKVWILPNIPSFIINDSKTNKNVNKIYVEKTNISLSYVGVLGRDRGIEDVLEFVSKNPIFVLNIAGFGVLQETVKLYSTNYKNIIFHGKVNYKKGIDIMSNSNIIIALYYRSNKNHIFAAPNKYYESLYLGIPILTTKNTLVGDKVTKNQTGYVFDENKENLGDILFNLKGLELKSYNCKQTFLNVKNVLNNFFNYKYNQIVT